MVVTGDAVDVPPADCEAEGMPLAFVAVTSDSESVHLCYRVSAPSVNRKSLSVRVGARTVQYLRIAHGGQLGADV